MMFHRHKKTFYSTFFAALLVLMPLKEAFALHYSMCFTPRDSSACYIAFQKLLTIPNPMMEGKVYFDDGRHFVNGELFMFPTYYIAEADLNFDGFKEIIATVPEPEDEMRGWFCKAEYECPHFIFQDRNINPDKLSLRNVKTFGPIYSYGIGLSTDEVVDGYRSLRSYRDIKQEDFHVYQYDDKTDGYYNVTAPQ
jgi:hypothetical protein